ncbi:hypothetical protein PVAND_000349 [Polypedilum vanderplanki]|uniref:5'-Nucleotidase C-terminal domain-containing protein n=1 Tax=Polypedilum vanderplanki TaxID=319348 RepID=A0A9J6BKD3_POLVA|nr:hypothetical protein PVAND_000349 [Polypedilum vanderplanki]
MGDLITDSMAYAVTKEGEWTGASIAFQVPGGVRASLESGNVIYADLITTTPFERKLISFEIPGFAIRQAMEYSVSELDFLHVLQVSGIKTTYNLSRDSYDRVIELKALCQLCDIPKYEDVDDAKFIVLLLRIS